MNAVRKIQNCTVYHSMQCHVWGKGLNLKREFSCLVVGDRYGDLLNNKSCYVPSRTFHKQLVEVNKRIQWKRPVKVPCIRPEKSGDLSGLPELDLSKPPPLFEESTEFQSANEYVKRIFSLKFQPKAAMRLSKIDSLTQKVKRHTLDSNSVEVKIARFTAIIRNMQEHYAKYPQDKVARAVLKEIIDFRRKRLKILRSFDYKRFEWLLEQLDLLYKPSPVVQERVERKKSILRLAAQYVENVKQKKLDAYKSELDSQKREFLQRKLSTMKAIVEEETSFGVEPSFTPDEISEVEEMLRLKILEEEQALVAESEIKEVY